MSRRDQHLGSLLHLLLNRCLKLLLWARPGLLSLDQWGSVRRGSLEALLDRRLAGLLDRNSYCVRRTIAYLTMWWGMGNALCRLKVSMITRIMGTILCLMMRDRRRW